MRSVLLLSLTSLSAICQPVDKNYLLGRFHPESDPRFVKPADTYTTGAARHQYLRKETYGAFVQMAEDARKEGIVLLIISATRNFDAQKSIWETKWKNENGLTDTLRALFILKYSAMPGTSRHHWGTDIDLNSLEPDYFESGEGLHIYQWLCEHAHRYGFCQPYTSKIRGRTGYEEEKWHWSYMPLATLLLDEYNRQIAPEDITGFAGSHTVRPLDVITKYVNGVACK